MTQQNHAYNNSTHAILAATHAPSYSLKQFRQGLGKSNANPQTPQHIPGAAYALTPINKRLTDYLCACRWTAHASREHRRMDRVDWRDFGITLEHASPQFNWHVRLAVQTARWSPDAEYAENYKECFKLARSSYATPMIVTSAPWPQFSEGMKRTPTPERLEMYIKSCWQAGKHNKKHPTSCRTVDPAYFCLHPASLGRISRDYDGLLYSMQGIAEFMPESFDCWAHELKNLQQEEHVLILQTIEQRIAQHMTVTDKPYAASDKKSAPRPAQQKPRPKHPMHHPQFAHLFRDKAWESLQPRKELICGRTKEQINAFYQRMGKPKK